MLDSICVGASEWPWMPLDASEWPWMGVSGAVNRSNAGEYPPEKVSSLPVDGRVDRGSRDCV